MLYRASYLLPMDGPPLRGGAMRIEQGRISAIGSIADLPPLPGEPVWTGMDHVLLPGLINTHAHLELHDLRGRLPAGLGFAAWVKCLREALADYTEADFVRACRLGALECLRYGTTTVVDIGNSGATPAAVADLPLRVFACLEVIGLDPALAQARLRAAEERLHATPNGRLLTKLLVPHAPYSVSLPLMQALRQRAQHNAEKSPETQLFTLHAGESSEEEELFANASGPLQSFCTAIYPEAPHHQGLTALAYLREHDFLPKRTLVVHANGRSSEEAAYLARLQASVVHCPQSHAFFGHPPFAADAYRDAGVPITLGTDSLASGTSLSLFDAMREFSLAHPDWKCEDILAMVTRQAGAALDPQGKWGRLAVGAPADFIAVKASQAPPLLFDALVRETTEVDLVVVAGEQVIA